MKINKAKTRRKKIEYYLIFLSRLILISSLLIYSFFYV